jgi:hypothetical protein
MLVEKIEEQESDIPQILVPDEYASKSANEHELVRVLALAPDCSEATREALNGVALVEGHMIKEIKLAGKQYELVLENYMLAIVGDA